MNDRELLELAAKAAGLVIQPDQDERMHHENQVMYAHKVKKPFGFAPWNPLVDDGDALRLAVKLDIEIFPDSDNGETSTAFCVGRIGYNTDESWGALRDGSADDPMPATRRAIVRAAAEMGRVE